MDKRLQSNIDNYTKYSIYQYLKNTQKDKKTYDATLTAYLKYISTWNDLEAICNMKNNIDNMTSNIDSQLSFLTKKNIETILIISTLVNENYLQQFSFKDIFSELLNFFSKSEELLTYLEEDRVSSIYRVMTNFFDALLLSKDIDMIRLFEQNKLNQLLNILETMFKRGIHDDLKSLKSSLFLYMINNKNNNSLILLNKTELSKYIENLDYTDFITQDKKDTEIKIANKNRSWWDKITNKKVA